MKLILIKHARPQVDPGTPSHRWKLSGEGRAAAARLAETLRPQGIESMVSSDEPKAIETAQVIAGVLGLPATVTEDLHEHDRSNVPHMRSGEFISHMELFFRKPRELTLGVETAEQCARRIASAIEAVVQTNAQARALAIVTHGTVLALHLAKLGAGRPFELWRRMGLPSYAIVENGNVTSLVDKLQE